MNIEKGTIRFGFKCSENVKVTINNVSDNDGVALYELKAVYSEEQIPEKFTVTFAIPDADIYSVWSPSWTPSSRFDRRLGPNWAKRASNSRLASWMPLHQLVSADGKNRIMLAISDAKTPLAIRTGVREETANVEWEIDFFTIKVAPTQTAPLLPAETNASPSPSWSSLRPTAIELSFFVLTTSVPASFCEITDSA